jgi:hypothetical protein
LEIGRVTPSQSSMAVLPIGCLTESNQGLVHHFLLARGTVSQFQRCDQTGQGEVLHLIDQQYAITYAEWLKTAPPEE